jgi:hypothetical protein
MLLDPAYLTAVVRQWQEESREAMLRRLAEQPKPQETK